MRQRARKRVGRRKGPVAFPGKTEPTSTKLTPELLTAYEDAERRTGHSRADVLHLVSLTKLRVYDVTKAAFDKFMAR